ncbi:MAG: hypothetical protein ISQ27_06045 [PS1 clade bacterium]|nr:hypothetical protein [PS1 clade bacterium]
MSSKVQAEPVGVGVPDAAKLGRVVYITAWIVEIVAAIVGLFIAFSQGLSVFISIPEIDRDFGAYTRAVIGAMPFVVIAILEPTKIYLASGLYHSSRNRRGGLTLAFMAALAALTFITFETMFNALIQQNTNVTRQVQRLVNERYETLDAIETNQLAISRIETQTPEAINTRFALSIKELEDERAARRKVAFEDYSLAVKEINVNRGNMSELSRANGQNYFSSTVSELGADQSKLIAEREAALAQINTDFESQIAEKQVELETLEANRDRRLERVDDIFFGRAQLLDNISSTFRLRLGQINNEIAVLKENQQQALNETRAGFDARIERVAAEQTSLRGKLANQRARELGAREGILREFNKQLNNAEREYAVRVREIDRQIDQLVSEVMTQKKALLKEAGLGVTQIPILQAEIDGLEQRSTDLRQKYRENIEKVQVYQLTAIICGAFEGWCFPNSGEAQQSNLTQQSASIQPRSRGFDVADIPEDKVRFVSTLWFGSTAAIVATMGTFLAFISFVLKGMNNERFEPRSRTSRLFFLMALRFTNLIRSIAIALIEIGIRLGDSVAYMISVMLQLLRIIVETFLEFVIVIVDALRILVIVMSRYVYAKTEETRRAMEARAELEDSERTRAGGRREGHLDAEFDEIVESDEMLAPRPAEEASRESATRSLAAMTQNLSETWQGTRRSLDESREKFSGWASRLRTNFARGLQETVDTLKSDMSRATQALRITPEEAAPPSLEAAVEEAEKADARKSARSGPKKSSAMSRRTAARATREKQWYED